MNTILDAKLFSVLALILALAIAPVSNGAFAQTEDIDATDEKQNESDRKRIKDEIRALTEQFKEERTQIRDQNDNRDSARDQIEQLRDQYKDRIRSYITDVRPDIANIPDIDREPDLKFYNNSDITGWAVLGSQAYGATMTSFEGTAIHMGKGVWKVSSTADIKVSERLVKLDLNGFARSGHMMLHGTGTLVTETLEESDNDPEIRVVLRGHYAPVAESDNEFAIAFTNAQVHNTNTGHRIPLALVGSVIVESLGTEPVPIAPKVSDVPTIDEVLS